MLRSREGATSIAQSPLAEHPKDARQSRQAYFRKWADNRLAHSLSAAAAPFHPFLFRQPDAGGAAEQRPLGRGGRHHRRHPLPDDARTARLVARRPGGSGHHLIKFPDFYNSEIFREADKEEDITFNTL